MGKLAEISNLILEYQIICLQETWLSDNNKFSFNNYNVFRNDRKKPRVGGGSLIICRNSLDPVLHEVEAIESLDYDVIVIFVLDKEISSERISLSRYINLRRLGLGLITGRNSSII